MAISNGDYNTIMKTYTPRELLAQECFFSEYGKKLFNNPKVIAKRNRSFRPSSEVKFDIINNATLDELRNKVLNNFDSVNLLKLKVENYKG